MRSPRAPESRRAARRARRLQLSGSQQPSACRAARCRRSSAPIAAPAPRATGSGAPVGRSAEHQHPVARRGTGCCTSVTGSVLRRVIRPFLTSIRWTRPRATATMRVPSVLTMSGSSTPASWIFVVECGCAARWAVAVLSSAPGGAAPACLAAATAGSATPLGTLDQVIGGVFGEVTQHRITVAERLQLPGAPHTPLPGPRRIPAADESGSGRSPTTATSARPRRSATTQRRSGRWARRMPRSSFGTFLASCCRTASAAFRAPRVEAGHCVILQPQSARDCVRARLKWVLTVPSLQSSTSAISRTL